MSSGNTLPPHHHSSGMTPSQQFPSVNPNYPMYPAAQYQYQYSPHQMQMVMPMISPQQYFNHQFDLHTHSQAMGNVPMGSGFVTSPPSAHQNAHNNTHPQIFGNNKENRTMSAASCYPYIPMPVTMIHPFHTFQTPQSSVFWSPDPSPPSHSSIGNFASCSTPVGGKMRQVRASYSEEQKRVLAARYAQCTTPSAQEYRQLASRIGVSPEQVKNWFTNRRREARYAKRKEQRQQEQESKSDDN